MTYESFESHWNRTNPTESTRDGELQSYTYTTEPHDGINVGSKVVDLVQAMLELMYDDEMGNGVAVHVKYMDDETIHVRSRRLNADGSLFHEHSFLVNLYSMIQDSGEPDVFPPQS